MTLGQIAGLIAALAAVVLVGLCAVPLLRLGGVFTELRRTVRDLDEATVPILAELRSTVVITNEEIGKLGTVTDDVKAVSQQAVDVAQTISTTVNAPVSTVRGLRKSLRRRSRRHDQVEQAARRTADDGAGPSGPVPGDDRGAGASSTTD